MKPVFLGALTSLLLGACSMNESTSHAASTGFPPPAATGAYDQLCEGAYEPPGFDTHAEFGGKIRLIVRGKTVESVRKSGNDGVANATETPTGGLSMLYSNGVKVTANMQGGKLSGTVKTPDYYAPYAMTGTCTPSNKAAGG